jgi:MSHA biogenesis protein MshP
VKHKQQGFTLISAIFILVVLALLGSYMVRLSATQRVTTLYALQGARAYQAARAGVEWSIARIAIDGNCGTVNGAALTFSGLSGFSVALACNLQSYTEVNNVDIYTVTSTSIYANYGDADYVYRQLQVSLKQ